MISKFGIVPSRNNESFHAHQSNQVFLFWYICHAIIKSLTLRVLDDITQNKLSNFHLPDATVLSFICLLTRCNFSCPCQRPWSGKKWPCERAPRPGSCGCKERKKIEGDFSQFGVPSKVVWWIMFCLAGPGRMFMLVEHVYMGMRRIKRTLNICCVARRAWGQATSRSHQRWVEIITSPNTLYNIQPRLSQNNPH